MKLSLSVQVSAGLALAMGANALMSQPSLAETKFFCGRSQGTPATMVRTEVGSEPLIRWTLRDLGNAGWSPDRRCQEVSARFQRFYDNGNLKFIRTGSINGQRVLCVSRYKGGPCPDSQVLVTLKKGTDAELVLQQLRDFRRGATSRPLQLTGTGTETYVDGETYIDVQKLLNTAPVGSHSSSRSTNELSSEPVR